MKNEFLCTKCGILKDATLFYKNPLKKNGLESQCKECVIKRKLKKYKETTQKLKKTKEMRRLKKVKVLEISDCTFEEQWIIRPSKDEFCFEKEFIGIVLCNYKLNMELATVA
jgi:hypothetical protein